MQLQQFNKDGLEIFVDTTSGETFASIRGYARMSGKHASTISRRVEKGVASSGCKTAEIQTAGGIQGVALLSEDFIAEWLPKDNPEMATQVLKLGVRFFLHAIAKYKHEEPKPEPKPEPELSSIIQAELELVKHQIHLEEMKRKNFLASLSTRFDEPDPEPEIELPPEVRMGKLPEDFLTEGFVVDLFQWMYQERHSVKDVAGKFGVSVTYIRRLLRGYTEPSVKMFCRFAELIDEDPFDLLSKYSLTV